MTPSPSTSRPPKSRVRALLSAFASYDGDPRAHLGARLSVFFLVFAALIVGLFFASLATLAILGGVRPAFSDRTTFAVHASIQASLAGTMAISWAIARYAKLSLEALLVLEAIALGLIGILSGIWITIIPLHYRPEIAILLATAHTLVGRAALVPSTPSRTAAIGAITLLPILIGTYFAYREGALPEWLKPAMASVSLAGVWGCITVVFTVITSRVIYGLRRRVEHAMQLGQYTVERLLGRGGMGAVYVARHALLRRPTAVKVLEAELAGPEAIARFEREVQTTSELTHPNTVAIYDYGRTPDACFYYAMEYLDGFDLETLVRADGPQPPARVAHILRQISSALAEAHARGLVHRDIKPANIMLCERGLLPDFVKVLDFGLVRIEEPGDPTLSVELAVRGTPLYMAPEAAATPGKVDHFADLYSLGALAYFLLCGHPPFSGRSALEIVSRQLADAPVPPSMRTSRSIPGSLEAVVMRCLEKEPERRPQSAAQLCDVLDSLDGIEAWSESDARRWWTERAPELRAAPAAASGTPPATVLIDLGRRHSPVEVGAETLPAHVGVARD